MSRAARYLAAGAAGLIILALVGFNALSLVDAYGDGPPYYGRTENMDKWESPLPVLAVIDLIGLALAGGLGWMARRPAR